MPAATAAGIFFMVAGVKQGTMIPPVFFLTASLPWLFAARCAAVYWQAMADAFATAEGSADVVRLVPASARSRRMPPNHRAELIRLLPK